MTCSLPVRLCGLLALLVFHLPASQAVGQCTASELHELPYPEVFSQDHFGNAVAIDGDVALVGAHLDGDAGDDQGGAYIFRFDGSRWNLEASLVPSDSELGDEFGKSIALDAGTAVIGANFDDTAWVDSGSAYVFEQVAGTWTQVAKLTVADEAEYDNFGITVAIDGDVIAVGANLDEGPFENTGVIHVFEKPPTGWSDMTPTASLVAADAATIDQLGETLSIQGDLIVSGAHFEDSQGTGAGAAYVFQRPPGGWVDGQSIAKLTSSDPADQDRFGVSVSLDGDTIVIGAWGDDDGGDKTGSVHVFEKPPAGWVDMTETAKLHASDADGHEHLGWSVSISGDVILAGAPDNLFDGLDNGAAYVYLRPPTGWADATEDAKLVASNGGGDDEFGRSLFLDGGVAVVGAWYHDTGRFDRSGAAYTFRGLADCQGNGTLDLCEIEAGDVADDDGNYVPDSCEAAGLPSGSLEELRVGKLAGADLSLSWQASCLPTDDDYAVYEGSIGDFRSHALRSCSTAGLTTIDLTALATDGYFLIVPHEGTSEGSYGLDSNGTERPAAVTSCLPQLLEPCP